MGWRHLRRRWQERAVYRSCTFRKITLIHLSWNKFRLFKRISARNVLFVSVLLLLHSDSLKKLDRKIRQQWLSNRHSCWIRRQSDFRASEIGGFVTALSDKATICRQFGKNSSRWLQRSVGPQPSLPRVWISSGFSLFVVIVKRFFYVLKLIFFS